MQTQTLTCAKVQQTKISHGKLFPSICKPQNLGDSEEFCIILSWHILFLCAFYVPHMPGSICWSQVSGQEKVYTLKKSLQWFTWLCPPMWEHLPVYVKLATCRRHGRKVILGDPATLNRGSPSDWSYEENRLHPMRRRVTLHIQHNWLNNQKMMCTKLPQTPAMLRGNRFKSNHSNQKRMCTKLQQ